MKTNLKTHLSMLVYMTLLLASPSIQALEAEALPPRETEEEVEKRIGPWLDLKNGGKALGPAQTVTVANPDGTESKIYGALNEGSLLPLNGEGFRRLSDEETSWGTGFMISLLVNASREFARLYDSQNVVSIGDIAMEKGGPYRPHSSHQNGLDADLLFMGMRTYDSVLDGEGNVTELFNRQKNWDYFKLLAGQKILQNGKPVSIVSMILVAPEIKTELCRWAKEKNMLGDSENQELMKILRPTAGHDDHFHIRLKCSPHHPNCRKQNISPRPCT